MQNIKANTNGVANLTNPKVVFLFFLNRIILMPVATFTILKFQRNGLLKCEIQAN